MSTKVLLVIKGDKMGGIYSMQCEKKGDKYYRKTEWK
jgi:hypothetical protein